MKRLGCALPALALALFACSGDGPRLPKGPGGGDNTIEVVADGVAEVLDSLRADAGSESGTVSIQLYGGRDPIENAVDDEYAYVLDLDLDEGALTRSSPGVSLTIKATVNYVFGFGIKETNTLISTGSTDPIRNINFLISRQSSGDSGSYEVSGEFVITSFSPTAIAGSLDLTFKGMLPNDRAIEMTEVRMTSTFDLAIEVRE